MGFNSGSDSSFRDTYLTALPFLQAAYMATNSGGNIGNILSNIAGGYMTGRMGADYLRQADKLAQMKYEEEETAKAKQRLAQQMADEYASGLDPQQRALFLAANDPKSWLTYQAQMANVAENRDYHQGALAIQRRNADRMAANAGTAAPKKNFEIRTMDDKWGNKISVKVYNDGRIEPIQLNGSGSHNLGSSLPQKRQTLADSGVNNALNNMAVLDQARQTPSPFPDITGQTLAVSNVLTNPDASANKNLNMAAAAQAIAPKPNLPKTTMASASVPNPGSAADRLAADTNILKQAQEVSTRPTQTGNNFIAEAGVSDMPLGLNQNAQSIYDTITGNMPPSGAEASQNNPPQRRAEEPQTFSQQVAQVQTPTQNNVPSPETGAPGEGLKIGKIYYLDGTPVEEKVPSEAFDMSGGAKDVVINGKQYKGYVTKNGLATMIVDDSPWREAQAKEEKMQKAENKVAIQEQMEDEKTLENLGRLIRSLEYKTVDVPIGNTGRYVTMYEKNSDNIPAIAGWASQFVPNSKVANAKSYTQGIKQVLGRRVMGQMKNQSPTGATGLGPTNETEIEMIMNVLGELSPVSSPSATISNAKALRKLLIKQNPKLAPNEVFKEDLSAEDLKLINDYLEKNNLAYGF